MFIISELMFKDSEYKFKGYEHKFRVFEHNSFLGFLAILSVFLEEVF